MACYIPWIVTIFALALKVTHGDYAADEASLIALLKANSSVDARPANRTLIRTALVLLALKTLDIGKETMSLSGVLYCEWTDQRLTWDPTSNSIYTVVINTKHLWTPPLVIENEVNNVGLLEGSSGTPSRVQYNGQVSWSPPISITTSCSADITYYPYDRQTCTITLIVWTYTVEEVDVVTFQNRSIDLTHYNGNGEWDLLSTGYEERNITGVDATYYRKVLFNLTFRRGWPYYGQNIILPIVLTSVLMGLVFVVPIESGEKMGYCLTVLLSFIVLLTMVSSGLPSISNQTSMLQMYLSIVLCVGTLSTVCTIAVLQVHNQDGKSKPVPGWLQKLTRYIFAPVGYRSFKSRRVVSPEGNGFSATAKKASTMKDFTWKEIAVTLDKFFFVIFTGVLSAFTIGILIALIIHYNS